MVAGDSLFGVWYIRPNKSKTFAAVLPPPLLPFSIMAVGKVSSFYIGTVAA